MVALHRQSTTDQNGGILGAVGWDLIVWYDHLENVSEKMVYRHDNWSLVTLYQAIRWGRTLFHAALIIERNHRPTKTNCYIHTEIDLIEINLALPRPRLETQVLPDTVREGLLFMSPGQKAVRTGLPWWPRLPCGWSALHRGLPVISARPVHLATQRLQIFNNALKTKGESG